MRRLSDWSFVRVLLLGGSWVLVCVLATAGWVLFQFWDFFRASSGSGGIGAVSFGLNGLLLAILFVPPVALIVAWLIARWQRSPAGAV
jgi:hypothetical protein